MDDILLLDLDGEPIKHYYQWDKEQCIVLSGKDINNVTDVHFCNIDSVNALVVKPDIDDKKIVVKVPNKLLQSAKPLIVYLYRANENTGSNTIWSSGIAVVPRPKPDDYIYTETETLCYKQLDKRIRELENGVISNVSWNDLKDKPFEEESGVVVKQLDEKYIPDTIARVSDIPEGSGSGITPHIGANGNWFIGETDTGMPSRGEPGPQGVSGVYVGPGEIPEGYNIQIDPTSEAPVLVQSVNGVKPDENGNVEVPTAPGSGINVNSAIPGQTIVVKEVDETGKPTQWEAADLPNGIKTSFTTIWTGSLSEGRIIANSSVKDCDLVFVTFYQIVSGRPHIFDVSFQPKQLKMAGSDYGVLLPLCLIDSTPTEQMLRIFSDYKTFTLIDTAKPYTMTKITGVKFNA